MNGHELLNRIIRASEKLSASELEMLMNVARRMKETATASDPGLCIKDSNDPENYDGLLIEDNE
ncbi:MAG: hypothetical protein ABII93_06105 [Chrysiogenia bacterium]